MKKVVFFLIFSLLIASCASNNGYVGKGYGPATKTKEVTPRVSYREPVKEQKAPTIVKTKKPKKNGRYGNKGSKPPKPKKSNVE